MNTRAISRFRQRAVLIGLLSFAPILFAQGEWVHMRSYPVVAADVNQRWESEAVFWPTVIKDGDTLRMWYCGTDDVLNDGTVKIGYAWSRAGITWRRSPHNPVLEADLPWELGQVISPVVLKDENGFHMWYGAGAIPSNIIGYATSRDGIHWIKHSEPVLTPGPLGSWDVDLLGPGAVLKVGNLFYMWYWGGQGKWPRAKIQIGLAISTNGINWIKYDDPSTPFPPFKFSDPVLSGGELGSWDFLRVWTPAVLKTEDGYEMWYAGREDGSLAPQMVGYATSTDGIHWQKWEGNPVIETRPVWGFSYLSSSVLRFNQGYHMWYTSFIPSNVGERAGIGYAWSPARPSPVLDGPPSPDAFALIGNFPNPFNSRTEIQFALPEPARVTLRIYDARGRLVRTLVNGFHQAGTFQVSWDGTNRLGRPVASGVYLYRLQSGSFSQTRKMLLVK